MIIIPIMQIWGGGEDEDGRVAVLSELMAEEKFWTWDFRIRSSVA